MKIAYYNNCWFTNVGEAFIDIGAFNIINQLWNNPKIACLSDMSDWYADSLIQKSSTRFKRPNFLNSSAKLYEYMEADYFIMAGMFASEVYLAAPGRKMVDEMVKNGAKLILLGLGGEKYSQSERDSLAKYYENIKPELIVTRDKKTYDAYKDCANTVLGLDCAFWVKNSFDPRGFSKKKYNVHAFNRTKEPHDIPDDGVEIIRPWHMQWGTQLRDLKSNYLVSDTPYDYLTLYANANRVYTDLVHGTIPALQYGTPVKYYFYDNRSNAFDAVEDLIIDEFGFMSVDEEKLEAQKRKLINLIKEVI